MYKNSWAEMSFNKKELEAHKSQVVHGRPYAQRVSLGFAINLDRVEDPFSIISEVDYLEGIRHTTKTKPEAPFKPPLYPFWHKHFSTARHIPKNLAVRWALDKGGNADLENILQSITESHGDQEHVWQNYLVDALITNGYKERAARGLTGDWIIYGKHDGQNYYIGLATHEEAAGKNAETLLKRLRQSAYAEFPFLFD